MTAEICVMNTIGVAMAADSAVTIGSGRKIYNSANKLFSLSKYQPIGIMIYGNAEYLRVPWETLIKVYREKLGHNNYATVEEYANNFIDFVINNDFPELTALSEQEKYNLNLIVDIVNTSFNVILESLKELVNKNPDLPPSEDDMVNVINSHIEEMLKKCDETDYISDFTDEDLRIVMEDYGEKIERIVTETFENMIVSEDLVTNLKYIAASTLLKSFSDSKSGIVIAGFGERELYPALYAYEIDGRINEKVKYQLTDSKVVGNDFTAAIVPFAQDDMVHTFIRGINPELEELSSGYLGHVLSGIPDIIIEQLQNKLDTETSPEELKKSIEDELKKIYYDFNEVLDNYKHENFTIPILSIVNSLPKDELAEMAEALVNLTSFKRRVSSGLETVGGPVDVAIITKGDGLVWIKRKHYFNKEINQQFHQNYFRRNYDESTTT